MRKEFSVAFLALTACSFGPAPAPTYSYKPIQPLHTRAEEATLEMDGKVLLSKWVKCEMDAAVVVARTTTVDPADGVKIAYQVCGKERAAWVDSQVAIGWPREASERVADGSEQCDFPIIEAQIEMTRRNASVAEREAYEIAHIGYSCDN